MLLDSNIIIYALKPEYLSVKLFMKEGVFSTSRISQIEVMGYWRLSDEESGHLKSLFSTLHIVDLDSDIAGQAIALRRKRKMALGDAIVAATALTRGMALVTHNVHDFQWIEGLQIIDPLNETTD
jgi:toxin FitB